ncbi:hypothetical protein PIB30_069181, partial [Stylosanthes scabra]|nr:hypothetical protein [Stylosanthes scabra]
EDPSTSKCWSGTVGAPAVATGGGQGGQGADDGGGGGGGGGGIAEEEDPYICVMKEYIWKIVLFH